MIPDVDDIQELSQKIWASFKLPQQMSEVHGIDNYYLAPQAPTGLCQKISSHCQIQGSPAGTSGRNNERRLWPKPRLCNAG